MAYGAQEGPTTQHLTVRTCGLCKWHNQLMIHSGRNPLYLHECNHPDAIPLTKQEKQMVAKLGLHMYPKAIGNSDETPAWCPVLRAKETKQQ